MDRTAFLSDFVRTVYLHLPVLRLEPRLLRPEGLQAAQALLAGLHHILGLGRGPACTHAECAVRGCHVQELEAPIRERTWETTPAVGRYLLTERKVHGSRGQEAGRRSLGLLDAVHKRAEHGSPLPLGDGLKSGIRRNLQGQQIAFTTPSKRLCQHRALAAGVQVLCVTTCQWGATMQAKVARNADRMCFMEAAAMKQVAL